MDTPDLGCYIFFGYENDFHSNFGGGGG